MPGDFAQRATYDEDGNIVLPGARDRAQPPEPLIEPSAEPEAAQAWELTTREDEPIARIATNARSHVRWETTEEDPDGAAIPAAADMFAEETADVADVETADVWNGVRARMYAVTSGFMDEGMRQYASSVEVSKSLGARSALSLGSIARAIAAFLAQPVWVPGRKAAKKRSRGTLFVTDAFRFGLTFAFLFLVLFVGLNYQSFLQIAMANIDPLSELRPSRLEREVEKNFAALGHVAVADPVASEVPPVGPPRNMLVIPKLKLHVPIVNPPTEALLREDWKTLETQIQDSLQQGVVHYPGTARPGQAGNFFVTGHSSYFPWAPGAFKSVFARLSVLQPGDEYWVFYGGDRHRYVVQEKKEVKPSDVTVLDQPVGRRLSTLMTCTPVGTTLRRLIVTAAEVDPVTGKVLEIGEHAEGKETAPTRAEMLPI